jgi:small subunit ribosomal protein S7
VIKEEMDKKAADPTSIANHVALLQMENIAAGGELSDTVELGHKYELPDLPLPPDGNLKYRYDPVVSQVTNLLMKDGKKSVAQRVGARQFYFVSSRVALLRRGYLQVIY